MLKYQKILKRLNNIKLDNKSILKDLSTLSMNHTKILKELKKIKFENSYMNRDIYKIKDRIEKIELIAYGTLDLSGFILFLK